MCTQTAPKIVVRKQGRTWGVYRGTELIEGGFFDRTYAEEARSEYERRTEDLS